MAKIQRFQGNLRPFAADALTDERTVFGQTSESDVLDDNITSEFLRGWGIVNVNENPTKQDFNALGFTLGQLIAYLHQAGVAEWNADQEYFEGSVASTQLGVYQSLISSNIGNNPDSDDGTNWRVIGDVRFPYTTGARALDQSTRTLQEGDIVYTDHYNSNRVAGSGGAFQFTGTTTAGKAGNAPDADGYFYDGAGNQFRIVGPTATFGQFGGDKAAALAWADTLDQFIVAHEDVTINVPSESPDMQTPFDHVQPLPNVKVDVNIDSGHALVSGVLIQDLPGAPAFRITSDDSTVFLDANYSGISISSISTHNNAVFVVDGSRGVTIDVLVDMEDVFGAGVFLSSCAWARVEQTKGVINSGAFGLIVEGGSEIEGGSTNFSGAGEGNRVTTNSKGNLVAANLSNAGAGQGNSAACLDVSRGSFVNLTSSPENRANLSGGGARGLALRRSKAAADHIDTSGCAIGVRAEDNSQISAASLVSANCDVGVQVVGASSVHAQNADLTNCTTRAAIVDDGSHANFRDADGSGGGSEGIRVQYASYANLREANFRRGASDDSTDIRVQNGGIAAAGAAIGGTNVTPNTLSSNGIIFQ